MTWETALGVIALLSFAASSAGQAWKLSKTIGSLENAVAELESAVKEFRENVHVTHDKLFAKLDEHTEQIGDLKTRVGILEKKGDKG